MLLLADLHLKPESADTVFAVLQAVASYAKANGHNRIAVLGDTFHVRYALPVELINRLDDELDIMVAHGMSIDFLVGNHDAVDAAGNNALQVFERPQVRIITDIRQDQFGLWLPYRKDIAPLVDAVAKSSAKLCFAHHGIQGAMMNSHVVAGELDGLPPAMFAKFQHTFLGHWHRHQTIANCTYVGSPYQTRVDEAGQQKGFIELNENTGEWRLVPLNIGPRYHKGDAQDAKRGDTVRLEHGTDPKKIKALQDHGIIVRVEPPPQVAAQVRINSDQSIQEQAAKYIQASATPDLNAQELMRIFQEVSA